MDYKVLAEFYIVEGKLFRRCADIVMEGAEKKEIDAYIVMMNPGSCCPKDDSTIKNLEKDKIGNKNNLNLSDAIADNAQKIVMGLMKDLGYNHVRLLNLSDICSANSKEANKIAGELSDYQSVFSEKRRKELDELTKEEAPFILGWGVGYKNFYKYKEMAICFLKNKQVFGYKKDNVNYYYVGNNYEYSQEARRVIKEQLKL
ncbi:MAG: hypothetical protein K6G85_03785 [Eubacterium sp.]|nr:hypothetical protein [Eubacterium sp.]